MTSGLVGLLPGQLCRIEGVVVGEVGSAPADKSPVDLVQHSEILAHGDSALPSSEDNLA